MNPKPDVLSKWKCFSLNSLEYDQRKVEEHLAKTLEKEKYKFSVRYP